MTTSTLLMIRPAAFGFNPQTAVNNAFQHSSGEKDVQAKALDEFDHFADTLQANDINVIVIQDTSDPHTPDAVFPNNWVSFHEDGSVVLYPMFAYNRRQERDKNIMQLIAEDYFIRSELDLTAYEKQGMFLEGTGSMVLDRDNRLAYACLSPRTGATVLYDFCNSLGYRPVLFNALDADGHEIYHTNVMMCMADQYVVICMDSIKNQFQKQMLLDKFKETGKLVVDISLQQMNRFAGNMLQVENSSGEQLLVMSTQAFKSLNTAQLDTLQSFNKIVHSPLNVIEQNGGGSARCMIAEIFLPRKHF